MPSHNTAETRPRPEAGMSKADGSSGEKGVRRPPAGIKSSDAETDEQEAHEDKNAAEEGAGTSTSVAQDSANDYKHHESHKSTEQHDNHEVRGRFRDLDNHASWREVYRACGVEGWR